MFQTRNWKGGRGGGSTGREKSFTFHSVTWNIILANSCLQWIYTTLIILVLSPTHFIAHLLCQCQERVLCATKFRKPGSCLLLRKTFACQCWLLWVEGSCLSQPYLNWTLDLQEMLFHWASHSPFVQNNLKLRSAWHLDETLHWWDKGIVHF